MLLFRLVCLFSGAVLMISGAVLLSAAVSVLRSRARDGLRWLGSVPFWYMLTALVATGLGSSMCIEALVHLLGNQPS